MQRIATLSFMTVLLLFNNCSITHITSTWKASDAVAKSYDRIMVLGIIREADRNLRIQMESHLVNDLKALNYNAFSAYNEYGPKMFQDMTEKQANEKLKKDGVGAVVTIVLLDKQKERYYSPARVVFSPYANYHNHLLGYYNSLHARVEGVGYYQVATKFFWESNFYDLNENKLLFSVQTQSFDPESTNSLAHEYGQKIIQCMLKNNVLQKQEEKIAKAM